MKDARVTRKERNGDHKEMNNPKTGKRKDENTDRRSTLKNQKLGNYPELDVTTMEMFVSRVVKCISLYLLGLEKVDISTGSVPRYVRDFGTVPSCFSGFAWIRIGALLTVVRKKDIPVFCLPHVGLAFTLRRNTCVCYTKNTTSPFMITELEITDSSRHSNIWSAQIFQCLDDVIISISSVLWKPMRIGTSKCLYWSARNPSTPRLGGQSCVQTDAVVISLNYKRKTKSRWFKINNKYRPYFMSLTYMPSCCLPLTPVVNHGSS